MLSVPRIRVMAIERMMTKLRAFALNFAAAWSRRPVKYELTRARRVLMLVTP
jgi:hypothetical protein